MNTKDFARDNRSDRQTVEYIDKCFPDLYAGTTFTFVVETVYPGDIRTLMVSTEQEKVFGPPDLESK